MPKKNLLNLIRCPQCHSTQSYHRRRDNMRRCFACGNEWPAGQTFKKPSVKKIRKVAA